MLPKFKWRDAVANERVTVSLAEALGLSLPVARVLVARGLVTTDTAAAFLSPDLKAHLAAPFDFPGVREAAKRLWAAVRERREIVVFGDFDADGVAAVAILVTALRKIGGLAEAFLPVREPEGYGLTFAALERCLGERGRLPGVLVTVDCGIGSVAEVAYLQEKGIEVILTDHHEPGEVLPAAEVIVNPRLGASPGAEHLCGAGVAFKVAHALAEMGKAEGWYQGGAFGGELLAAVGLATVTDIVPLTGENRVFVATALKYWSRYAGEGLRALLSRASPQTVDVLDAKTFGFVLGPRINAAGRMGSAMVAYELLTTQDRDRATELAAKLEAFNGERRGVEARIVAAARQRCGLEADGVFGAAAVVVGGDGPHAGETGWHPGVIGIVAARLSEETGRPAAVVAFDKDGAGRGSVRACEGYHALKALAAASETLEGFGGHARAAGFRLKPGHFDAFKRLFCEACEKQAVDAVRTLKIDGWLSPEELSLTFYREQQRLAPFGMGNPTPHWGVRGVALENVRLMGASGEHLQFAFATAAAGHTLRGVWFRNGNQIEALRAEPGRFDVIFELTQNDFGGESSAELRVIDMAPESKCDSISLILKRDEPGLI